MVGEKQQSSKLGGASNNTSGGGNPGRKKSSRRRSRRRRGGKSGQKKGPEAKAKQPVKSNFQPERLVPLGVEPLPAKKVHAEKFIGLKKKNYGVLVYETLQAAEKDLANIAATSEKFDQLNVVIKAEGPRSHAEIDKYGKLFCGEAWHLIHERRIEDGWYNEPQY